MNWLIQQTQTSSDESSTSAGFFNELTCGSAVWTGKYSSSTSPPSFYVYDLDNDKVGDCEHQNVPFERLVSELEPQRESQSTYE